MLENQILCPFAVYYLRYAVTSFFTLSRISLADGKRAGQKVLRKIAAAVQNVKRLYFLSRSFEISETNCPAVQETAGHNFFLRDNLGVKKVEAPSKCPSKWLKKLLSRNKKNYVPQFLKQRDINSYFMFTAVSVYIVLFFSSSSKVS
jgi:hypothetical protein